MNTFSIKITCSCYKCGRSEAVGNITTDKGWLTPYHVMQKDSQLQTQLCPDCHGFSLYMWLRKNPKPRFLHWLYATLSGYFCAVFVNHIPPRYIAGFESLLDPIILFQPKGDKFPMRKEGKLRQIYEKVSKGQRDTHHPCARWEMWNEQ